jgi:hypothetical protein
MSRTVNAPEQLGADGVRQSKRQGAIGVAALRERGWTPARRGPAREDKLGRGHTRRSIAQEHVQQRSPRQPAGPT